MKLVVGLALIAGVLSAPTAPLTDRQVHIGAPAGVAGTSVGFGGSVGVGAHVGAGAGVAGGIGIREVSESKESANAPALETRQLHIGIPAGATGAGAGVGGSVGGSVGVGAHVGAGVGGGIGIREVSSESDDSASTANLEARQLHIGIPAGAVGAGVGVGGSASVGGHVGGGVGAGIGIREASQ